MNETPRGLNRFLIALFAVIVLILGAVTLALATVQPFVNWWGTWAPDAVNRLFSFATSTSWAANSSSWLWIVVAVALILLIILMISWIAGQGRGRTTILAAEDSEGDGEEAPGLVSINGSVAEQLLRQALNERPELLGASVSTYEIKNSTALKIRVLPRQGVSPKAVTDMVSGLVDSLDATLGQRTPILLRIGSATRARFSRGERVH